MLPIENIWVLFEEIHVEFVVDKVALGQAIL
jgi:hypothetical protein